MNHTRPHPASRWRLLTLLALGLALAGILAIGSLAARNEFLMRGIPPNLPSPVREGGARIGINVYLNNATTSETQAVLREIRASGIDYVKQPFNYQADFDWAAADRIVTAAAAEGLKLVPLLDGDPATDFAPPSDLEAYAAWAGEFARRYGDTISHYMIWDEPNLSSHWGGDPVNPSEYAALLSAAAGAIRSADSDAVIVTGPLAPTTETGPDNLAEPLFLEALYRAGAADAFDIVAVKPYGFDSGPDDRTVNIDHLNFSRAILAREVLTAQGDGEKAVWAGNWGWNSLPEDWTGRPSIWGQTTAQQQADQTVAALERARREWPWMGVLFLENWEPAAADDDPRWGFSIAGRPAAEEVSAYLAAQSPAMAMPGFHPADPADLSQQYTGEWEFSPEFGADIGQSGDKVIFSFWGSDVGVRVRRADFRARLYATIDGRPANALPRDENGATLVLTSADAAEDMLTTEWIARDLEPGPHVLELVASRGWDQWALNGFTVGYRPAGISPPWQSILLAALSVLSLGLAFYCARRADWGEAGQAVARTFHRQTNRMQLLLTGAAAGLVTVTGWLTWGQDALGLYRRFGDLGQLAATAAAATVFYVTPSFVVFSLALVMLFCLLVLRPAWGIALIAVTMPFYVPPLPKPILGYHFSPVEVFALVSLAAWVFRSLLETGMRARSQTLRITKPRLIRADWAVLAFLAVATLSLFFAQRSDVAFSEWRVVIIEPVILYFLLRAVRPSEAELWVVLDAFVLSGVIVALYGLWQYLTGQDLITAEGGLLRLRSFYGSPNNVALYLDRLLPILVAIFLLGTQATHGRRRLLYGALIVPVGLALLLTFSKGALFLGIPASMMFIFWIWQRDAGRRTWPWLLIATVAGLAAVLVAVQVPALAARLDLFGETGFFRINLWRSAANMFVDHPWLGVGLDNFLYAYRGRYILDAAWQEPNLNHPHNVLLDFATRLGLLGLLAGGWMVWEAGRAIYRAIRNTDDTWRPVAVGLGGSLLAMLAHGLVDHSFFLVDLAFFFFLLLGVAVRLIDMTPTNDTESSHLSRANR